MSRCRPHAGLFRNPFWTCCVCCEQTLTYRNARNTIVSGTVVYLKVCPCNELA